jgi:restriction system protein
VLDILTTSPCWASIVVAATVYIGLKWILPTLLGGNVLLQPLAGAMKSGAWIFALIFLIPAPFAVLNTAKRRKLLDTQTGLESVRAMGWREFEMLVGEAFRRRGYRVEECGGDGPDGGIDLTLYREGRTSIVQCKRWRFRLARRGSWPLPCSSIWFSIRPPGRRGSLLSASIGR